jgi:hypothetical protein
MALAAFAALSACASGSEAPTAPRAPCNGAVRLCDLPPTAVVFATTHNGMSNDEQGFLLPNQPYDLVRQLDDGIRGFMLDVYPADDTTPEQPPGKAMLCHGSCLFGARPFDAELTRMREWLDQHPREFLLFVLQDSASEAAMTEALASSGLLPMCLHQPPGAPWPTLGELLAVGKRVFLMTESGGGQASWRHGYQDVAQDNPYAATSAAELSCARLRGKPGNPLLVVNHFITLANLTPLSTTAAWVNYDPVLSQHVLDCQKTFGQLPNMVAVNWYTTGDLMALVRRLNGLEPTGLAQEP